MGVMMLGRKSSEKLELLGIKTIGDLAKADINFLKKHFKSFGITMWEYANGIDNSKVINEYENNKCISVSETFEVDVDNVNRIKKILLEQTEKVTKLLRKQNCYTKTVAITIRTYDFKLFARGMEYTRRYFRASDHTMHWRVYPPSYAEKNCRRN